MTTKKTVSPAEEEVKENAIPTLEELLAENNRLRQQLSEKTVEVEEDVDIDIRPDKYIQVMSLCNHKLNLMAERGKTPKVKFYEFGQVKRVIYKDLVDILETHDNFLEEGLFYILNKDVIRRHGLNDVYEKILTKDKIESILNSDDAKNSLELFKSASKRQRDVIVDMLIAKVRQDEKSVDMNLIREISKEAKVEILELAEEGKAFLEQTLQG